VAPATDLEQLTRPGQRLRHRGIGHPGGGLDIHHLHRLVRVDQQEIRHVPADPAADPCAQQERLGGDCGHVRVEVGQQQAGKLQPALVDHVAAGRR
jgi:hypothetical protein